MARNVEGPGGEAAVCGGPHSQLTARLVVQDLSRPLLPHRLHTQEWSFPLNNDVIPSLVAP